MKVIKLFLFEHKVNQEKVLFTTSFLIKQYRHSHIFAPTVLIEIVRFCSKDYLNIFF
jgi:hypothetical protein